ncbi:exodeoxyribonuclease VII small subunit [Anaeromyxobacter oryzisoli]|uniref:exodeoxyribonuclease VII small subunit n=1 Tax=Anaeromyxobacter oryzisoli TaxID=2925408 RepID=UPI001F5A5D76|nr:exodeoxyribonuclease VII small subunit [Anaeromyxobacter sp. SG63]
MTENERGAAVGGPGAADEPYDVLVERLERVVGELESGQLTLEQSIEKFAEGVRLAKDASRKLDEAERRVELLVRSADGDEEAVPFEPAGGRGP